MRTTDRDGFVHPTGVASVPVAMFRDGIRAAARTLTDAVRALEVHPCFGLSRGLVTGERTSDGWTVEALFAEPRGVSATCWQGHEVPLVDGVGRCHCGETISVGKVEVPR
jgi:hypothetical protein